MALDPKVFKAYDVRGLYPEELDEEGAYAIGRAYVGAVRAESDRGRPRHAPVVALDGRSGRRGRRDGGADVVDIGMVGTEMLYFAVGQLGLDGGIAVTASHNPAEYTGMKIVRRGALPGRRRLRASWTSGGGPSWASAEPAARGALGAEDVYAALADRVLSFVDSGRDQPAPGRDRRGQRHGGRDAPAGARPASDRGRPRFFFEPDGSFPTTSRTRSCRRTASSSSRGCVEEEADLGVAFDGDADRCFFVDDTGEFVPGDFVTALLAEAVLERDPGATIIYDVRASWAVPDTVEAARRHGAREPRRPRLHQAPDARGGRGLRRGGLGSLLLPRLLPGRLGRRSRCCSCSSSSRRRGRPLSELLAPLRERYFLSGEINTRRRGRGGEAPGAEGALRARGRDLPPRRHLGHRPPTGTSTCARRTPSRCSASTSRPSPRAHGAQARRGAGGHPRVSEARGRRLARARRRPTGSRRSSSRRTRGSASPTPTRRASSTTAATCRTSTSRGSSTSATSACSLRAPERGASS